MATASNWFFWALLSAVFAALTAIFAKIGLEGVDSDLATLVRTAVIMAVLAGFVYFTGSRYLSSNSTDHSPPHGIAFWPYRCTVVKQHVERRSYPLIPMGI